MSYAENRIRNLIGERFGKLIVLEKGARKSCGKFDEK